jgi:hypothetical protein
MPVSNREAEKKERELIPCRWLAKEINSTQGTDYKACASNKEPADVLLRSVSGRHPEIAVQVVSIPLDWRQRDDIHCVTRTKEALTGALQRRGLEHCLIDLAPTAKTEKRGIPKSLVERLADLVFGEAAKGNRQLDYRQIGAYSPQLSEYINYISIFCHRAVPKVRVDIASGALLPPDGRWIEEGIAKKVVKYGGATAVKNLTLVIDIASVVDDEQIAAFKAAHVEGTLPFSEIWILGLQGIVCLKRKAG